MSAIPFNYAFSRLPMTISPSVPVRPLTFAEIVHYGFPGRNMSRELRAWKTRNISNLMRGAWRVLAARKLGVASIHGYLCLAFITPDGHRTDYGLVSMRMITTAGAGYVCDAFQGLASLPSVKYHGIGGGALPEAITDTALGSEFSAQYLPLNTRAEGTASEGEAANFYRSVGFIEVSNTVTIAEHGLFSAQTAGTGVLLDRSAIESETVFENTTVQCDFRLEIATGT